MSNRSKKPDWIKSNQHYSFWMKFYSDQCGLQTLSADGFGIEGVTYDDQLICLKDALVRAKAGLCSKYHFDGQVHYNDDVEVSGSPFIVAKEKPHAHLYCKARSGRVRFDTFLNDLRSVGIVLDRDQDLDLLRQVIEKGHGFPNEQKAGQGESYCIVYNRHSDPVSRDIKGKFEYSWDDPYHISTYSEDDFNRFLLEQARLNNSSKSTNSRDMSPSETLHIMREARDLGASGGDFDKWFFEDLQPEVRRGIKSFSQIQREYDYGIDKYLSDPIHTDMTRVCLFIEGSRNIGKSGSLVRALSDLGYPTYIVSQGGGTGKMDEFKYWHKALVLDDTSVTGFFSYADDKVCRAYRRNSGNPLFACTFLAVTSNKDISSYYNRICHPEPTQGSRWIADEDPEFLAFQSRFVRLKVDDDGNIVDIKHELRGDKDRVLEKVRLLEELIPVYKRHLAEYRQKKASEDVSADIEQRLNALIL